MPMIARQVPNLTLRLAVSMLCAGGAGVASLPAWAEPSTETVAAEGPAVQTGGLDEIIVTGSRQGGIKAVDSAAPIQLISAESLKAASGSPDLMSALSQVVPSLTMQAFGADMAGQTLQAKLRGLSPNHVLILVNGKRRHTTANLAVDNGSTYQGGAGVDLNFIPVDAIDHVEVLTEGAAAQYGTDAIAGVINIILKKKSSGGVASATYGQYGNNGGGKTEDVSTNGGFEPFNGAYLNLTGEYHKHGHSNVGAEDPRLYGAAGADYPTSNEASVPGYPYVNAIEGDAATQTKLAMLNSGFTLEGGQEVYAFGSFGDKHAASYENYRTPTKQAYTNPTTGVTTYPTPYGFSPQEMNREKDYSATIGVKGTTFDWNWDLSTTFGGDRDDIYTISSANTGVYNSTGVVTPSDYYDGYLKATQWTSNADVNRDFDVGMAGPLNVAFGAEFRRDTYTIGAGTPISYENGGAASYPGFTPTDAGSHARKNYAAYVDFAGKPVDKLRIDAAARYEYYNDFGSATVGKFTARYDFTPTFAVRGTVSTGFRAPTLAEEYYSSTNVGPTTAYVQLPPNSAGGKLLGLGDGLKPEKSVNWSGGIVWRPLPSMSATLDVFQILVTNRIVGTGNINGTLNGVAQASSAAVNAAIAANGNTLDPDVVATGSTGINVFANGIDTRTRGADLVFDFPVDYDFGKIDYSVGATYNSTVITKLPGTPAALAGATLYDAEAISDLTTATPKYVVNLGALTTYGKFSVNLVEKVYGPASEYENDDGDNSTGGYLYYKTSIGVTLITNLDVGYQFTDHLKADLGADNLFNRFPNKINGNIRTSEIAAQDNAAVEQYPSFSPFGINGGFYYVKVAYSF